MPAPRDDTDESDLEGIDVEEIDMSHDPEAPDFSDLKEEGEE
jgi:hypothetical protein